MSDDRYEYVSLTRLTDMVRDLQKRMMEVEERGQHIPRIDKLERRMDTVEEDLFYHKGILTFKQTMVLLGIGKSELYKLSQVHGLPFKSVAKRKRVYLVNDLIDWLNSHPNFSGNHPFKK